MPKKNKKPSRNGYWEFVLEIRSKQPSKHSNAQELQDYASRKWAAMSKQEREPYETRAQISREHYHPAKLTTDGLEIEEVEKKEKEAIQKQLDMKADINNRVKSASMSLKLEDQKYLLIHINHVTYYPAEDRYFICEIAIAAFSLKNGIEDIFHSLVKPGKLPVGFYGGALAHSKETHQLLQLVYDDDPEMDDTREVFSQMTQFLKKFRSNHTLPILYTDEKTFEMTTKVIDQFRQDFGFTDEIKIYSMEYLFFALRNAAAGRKIWPSETFSYSELGKDVYSYTSSVSCDYHEMADLTVYCSKSIVTRNAFTICDHCCADLNIQLIPGAHVPNNAKVRPDSTMTSKYGSVCGSEALRGSAFGDGDTCDSSCYEDDFPALGSSRASVASVVSFSSMKTGASGPTSSKAAARIEQSFKAISINSTKQDKRDHANLKFPEHGFKKRNN